MNTRPRPIAAGVAAVALLAVVPAWSVAAQQTGAQTTEQTGAQTEEQSGAQARQGQSMQQSAQPEGLYSLRVQEITGMKVANVNGDTLGSVEQVVRDAEARQVYAVISVGGFLGIGDKQVALPIDDLQVAEDRLVMTTNMDEKALKEQANAYQQDQYEQITGDLTIAEATGRGGAAGTQPTAGAQELPSFSALDQNGDGIVSREEAREAAALMRNWDQADRDQDGQLNESEFSAFEQMHTREQPGMQPGGMQQHDQTRDAGQMQQQSPQETAPESR